MPWSTPTIITRRGRYVRQTFINTSTVLTGTTRVALELEDMPLAIYAGSVQAKSTLNTNGTDKTTIGLRSSNTTFGGSSDRSNFYWYSLLNVSNPDYWRISGFFEHVYVDQVNYMGAMVLPTNEIRLMAYSDNAAQTTEVVEVWISILSHRLEV